MTTEDDIVAQQMAELQAAQDMIDRENAAIDAEEAAIRREEAANAAHLDYIDRLAAGDEPVDDDEDDDSDDGDDEPHQLSPTTTRGNTETHHAATTDRHEVYTTPVTWGEPVRWTRRTVQGRYIINDNRDACVDTHTGLTLDYADDAPCPVGPAIAWGDRPTYGAA